jgi:hypothetical protein
MSGESHHDPALELLRDLDPATTLSPAAKRRIVDRMKPIAARWSFQWPWLVAPCAAALALFLLRTARHPQPPPHDGTQAFVVPACAVTRVADDRYAAALLGPAEAEIGGVNRQVSLRSGRLIVRTKQQAVEIAGPDARVLISPSSFAEIEARDLRMLRVAVYEGKASVQVMTLTTTLAIPAGSSWVGGEVHPLEPVDAEHARQILEPATNPVALCPAPSLGVRTTPSTEPVTPPTHRARVAHAELPRPAIVAAPMASSAAAPSEPSVSEEARQLADAIRRLRTDHDPRSALALLDEISHATPFAEEVALVRIEALLALGNRNAALSALDALPLPEVPRGAELLVLRGDLRGEASRWAEAINDYSRGITSAQPELVERSLFRRAHCRMATGDKALAVADLQDYLRRFPQGAFADEARRLLAQ